jgi:hypothetical protein
MTTPLAAVAAQSPKVGVTIQRDEGKLTGATIMQRFNPKGRMASLRPRFPEAAATSESRFCVEQGIGKIASLRRTDTAAIVVGRRRNLAPRTPSRSVAKLPHPSEDTGRGVAVSSVPRTRISRAIGT